MSWQEYQNNDRREQEQLEVIRALIEDATKDTVLWLQADPSAEERVHVLAIQERLSGLASIIERGMERRKETKDEWEYSETVSEALSLLDKAREVRGNIVGKGLARLAERLPREFSGPQPHCVSQAAAPPTPKASDPAAWRSRADEFKQLADEETRIILATKKERLLADCEFDSTPTLERTEMFELRQGPDEHLKARFEALATKCGIALGCPKDSLPLKFWLCNLFAYLHKSESQHLFAPTPHVRIGENPQSELLKSHAGETFSRAGGIITNVYEASANFCFWLEKQALETEHRHGSVGLTSQNKQPTPSAEISRAAPKRGKKGKKSSVSGNWYDSDPNVVCRRQIVLKNPNMKSKNLCKVFDGATPPISLPRDWQGNLGVNTWSKAYTNPTARKRIQKIISTDRKAV